MDSGGVRVQERELMEWGFWSVEVEKSKVRIVEVGMDRMGLERVWSGE
jgi:hypothetical protein